ncbi:MAG: WbqC family protein [Pseudomonadales bacterium]|nr:WbqC family protein [Pseudomonadales bacterium]
MHTVAIIQPSYIPWRGQFDFIHEVDCFVFLDDVQYTVRDWRNRNRIKMPDGSTRWLTIPTLGGRQQLIMDVRIDHSRKWAKQHLEALRHSYVRAPHFKRYFAELEEFYLGRQCELLVDFTIPLTELLAGWLGLAPRFRRASEFRVEGVKDARLIAIAAQLNAQEYLSGPTAQDYLQPALWEEAGIGLRIKDYSGYPEYPQIATPFEPHVTLLDLVFMVGDAAPEYIWGSRRHRD